MNLIAYWNQNAADELIPERMQGALRRWVTEGIEPGGFVSAILENNLFEAFARADAENSLIIKNYLLFLYNHAPAGCYGSKEKCNAWASMFQSAMGESWPTFV